MTDTKKTRIRLTKAEREWLDRLQAILSDAPTDRLGFYTIGDPSVFVYDRSKDAAIDTYSMSHPNAEFSTAVDAVADGTLATLIFPATVHSTAG